MTDYLDPYLVEDLIRYVDNINLKFGATTQITDPTTPEVLAIVESWPHPCESHGWGRER